ncbi:Hydrogen peroxide-inducible genes activator [Pigmentiphaga humi]|uniref:Hydrogen peroxide-inducible genes activator n=1 Tax=Pigmentiphaga humi TaxID=2478468 RepID=A0A3P4AY40_9BURK|nr:LysR family transcriptional regulator [Pigmentiphaga humi]VCU68702.1 Hydrogen peroxide-inducible genes activator [Pigmentiphaga humi]
MNLSIRHFKAFLAVVHTHSFTRAAEQMHISQPGLSLMMQDMESQLSCRLFERTTRSIQLTAAGQRLLPIAQQVVDEVETIAPVLSQLSEKRRRTLRVGVPPIFSASVIPLVYMRLRKTEPTLDLRIVDLPKPEVERQVRNGELDCGLGVFPKRVPEVSRRPLFEFDFVYLESRAAPARPKTHGRPSRRIRWDELPAVPFVELHHTQDLQQQINKCRAAAGAARTDGIRMNRLESLIGMAAAGVGPTIIPTFAAPVGIDAQVSTALLVDPVLSLDFHLIIKRGREQPDVMEPFTRTLLEVIEERRDRIHRPAEQDWD